LEQDGQRIRCVYERNDVTIREMEGLTQGRGWFGGDGGGTKTQIVENGITYEVDFENGQKTGFFLDQKYNRRAVARLAKGRRVLDCFTHTGSFALNAAHGGAAYVRAVDVSETA
ncbi:class I SAM-dependent methyltransferase, partial [Anaerotruncus colihominis]|uniref:class I SAM-dependent methyltransferase n=1 Tax=Anaerotruncus colihominis TaxID=169435 RepID=UPI00210990B5